MTMAGCVVLQVFVCAKHERSTIKANNENSDVRGRQMMLSDWIEYMHQDGKFASELSTPFQRN